MALTLFTSLAENIGGMGGVWGGGWEGVGGEAQRGGKLVLGSTRQRPFHTLFTLHITPNTSSHLPSKN